MSPGNPVYHPVAWAIYYAPADSKTQVHDKLRTLPSKMDQKDNSDD